MNSLQIFNIAVKRNGLFFVFKIGRTSGDRFKLQQRRFRLNTRQGEIRLTGKDCEAFKYAAWRGYRGL